MIVFVTKRVLQGPSCHIRRCFAATDFAHAPGIEIIDLALQGLQVRPQERDLPTTASSTCFVLGPGWLKSRRSLD